MPISHYLDLATPASADQVAGRLSQVMTTLELLGTSPAVEDLLGPGVVTGAGTWIRVATSPRMPWQNVIAGHVLAPTVTVGFELDKVDDPDAQRDDMIRVVAGLLDHVTGDAALHTEYETVWLLRIDGNLQLNDLEYLWPHARLAAFGEGVHRAELSFGQ